MDIKAKKQESIDFARAHLRECAGELLAWQDTGTLPDGKMRELARMCTAWTDESNALSIAEHTVQREALRRAHRDPQVDRVAQLEQALNAMWAFASAMVAKHGMEGDESMTDAEHQAFQEAGAQANTALVEKTPQEGRLAAPDASWPPLGAELEGSAGALYDHLANTGALDASEHTSYLAFRLRRDLAKVGGQQDSVAYWQSRIDGLPSDRSDDADRPRHG